MKIHLLLKKKGEKLISFVYQLLKSSVRATGLDPPFLFTRNKGLLFYHQWMCCINPLACKTCPLKDRKPLERDKEGVVLRELIHLRKSKDSHPSTQ